MKKLPTPLSDLITQCVQGGTKTSMESFEEALLTARLGIIVEGAPEGTKGAFKVRGKGVTCGVARTPDGKTMIHACADREAFVQRYNPAFNAEIDLRGAIGIALANPACQGILINSAASEHSIALDRDKLSSLQLRLDRQPGARPWWKFW